MSKATKESHSEVYSFFCFEKKTKKVAKNLGFDELEPWTYGYGGCYFLVFLSAGYWSLGIWNCCFATCCRPHREKVWYWYAAETPNVRLE